MRHVGAAPSPPCVVTPIQTKPFPGLPGLRWLKATPVSAGITAHLFYGYRAHGAAAELHTHGKMPDGGATKILWLIDHGDVGDSLTIDGKNLAGPGRTHQVFELAGAGVAAYSNLPSIVDVPTPGCWRFRVKSGVVAGTVTLRAIR